MIKLSTQIG